MRSRPLWMSFTAALVLASGLAAQQPAMADEPLAKARLIAATADDFVAGALVELTDAPGGEATALAPTDGGRFLRRFGQQLFVVNRALGTILRTPLDGSASQTYDLGSDTLPVDVLLPSAPVASRGMAWVTRRHDPLLLRLDLASGASTEPIDLSPVGGGSEIALGTMIQHGARLFVQVRIVSPDAAPASDTGALAVIDLRRGELIDVDLAAPGVQGIALQGAPPRLKMQIIADTLYVSTTESLNDIRGGIEMVDLATLSSVGYAISEATGHSDMGAFVMLDSERGYYVFHTDLLASTHLMSFTVEDGPGPGGMIDLLGDTVGVIVHDPWLDRIYLPSGASIHTPGLYVFSTETNELVGPPLSTVMRPHDVVLAPAEW